MLLLALMVSLGWKLGDSSSRLGDGLGLPALFLIGVIFAMILLLVRKILRD